jgi:methylase of polypeptide subunit release factors
MATGIIDYELAGVPLKLKTSDETFLPNLTTKLIAENVAIPEGSRVLDLGCGVGPLAVYAAKQGAGEVVAVDIMEQACEYARINAELNGVADRVRVTQSNLFEGLEGERFDIIIDDVSGMAEDVSRISSWYPSSIPTGGRDGTEPTIRMLNEAVVHLNPDGQLYFPILSLADSNKIFQAARDIYGRGVKLVTEKWVPFCKEFKENLHVLEDLRNQGLVGYITRRSRQLWCLQIYCAVPASA